MRLSKEQVKKIVRQEKNNILSEAPITRSGAKWEDRVMLRDVDNAQPYATRVTVTHDMVAIEFSNSFRIHLDAIDAQNLGDVIKEAGLQLEDTEAGRNPGGSIG